MSQFNSNPANLAAFNTTAQAQQLLAGLFAQAKSMAAAIDNATTGATTFPADHVHTRLMVMVQRIGTFNALTLNADVGAFIKLLYADDTFNAGGLKTDVGAALDAIIAWVATNYTPPQIVLNGDGSWSWPQVDPADFTGLRTLLGNLLALAV